MGKVLTPKQTVETPKSIWETLNTKCKPGKALAGVAGGLRHLLEPQRLHVGGGERRVIEWIMIKDL